MDEKLYNLMNWPDIEAIAYSEYDKPHDLLGPHKTSDGILIHTYLPTAKNVSVLLTDSGKMMPIAMEKVDEAGFFSVLLPGRKIPKYKLRVVYDNDVVHELYDPYSFSLNFDEQDSNRFNHGIHYEIYEKLGAHPCSIDGVQGVMFAVWAPNAIRVSVVGDFNLWDGRRHPMYRHDDSGVFEVFIPELEVGSLYKYELKVKGGMVVLKADPYANYSQLRPETASRVWDISQYQWKDEAYLKVRKKNPFYRKPMNIYEVHLSTFRKPGPVEGMEYEEKNSVYNYRELAPLLASYVEEMGYTHVEIMPMMEYPYDGSWGYQVTGYYAPTARYGTPDDFMYFVDYMHKRGIGIILDWVPAHFPRDAHGLANFDGTCLYEHADPRQGAHPHWGTLIYNYGRPQVSNFLIANALFWLEKYHIDGIRVDAVASMLYLDYGKSEGEWIPNMYGGNENLEAIELLKHMNSIISKRNDGSMCIAEESTAWPKVSHPVGEEGLGFQFKWNMGWMNDFLDYMKCDPLFRKGRQGELTFSMIYAYSEHFILVLSHDEVVHGKCSLFNKMPGDDELKLANLRALYGFMYTHPGKKLLFMGQEFGMRLEWNEETEIQWSLLEQEGHAKLQQYMKDLNHFYLDHKQLYELDYEQEGFEWIDNLDSDRSILVFLRRSEQGEPLLIVCNFTPNAYDDYQIGVPFRGKYKEIFNSDKEIYGGHGNVNPRLKQSKAQVVQERENSIAIKVPPMGIAIFCCTPAETDAKNKENKLRNTTKTTAKSRPQNQTKDATEQVVKEAKSATKARKKDDQARKESADVESMTGVLTPTKAIPEKKRRKQPSSKQGEDQIATKKKPSKKAKATKPLSNDDAKGETTKKS